MIKLAFAASVLLLASACGSKSTADNKAATPATPAAQPANSANGLAAMMPKPQQQASENDSARGGAANASDAATQPGSKASGCAAETSLAAAQEMVRICREVSPATHPPCNIENSCATIREEINRSCRLLGADAPADCQGG